MKKFNLIFILALLLGIFVFPTRALASTDPLNHVKNDLPQEELVKRSTFTINNDDDTNLDQQIDCIFKQIDFHI